MRGGLLLLHHVTPLTRRDVVYFYSGAHNLWKRTFHLLALGDNGKVSTTGVKVHQRITVKIHHQPEEDGYGVSGLWKGKQPSQ